MSRFKKFKGKRSTEYYGKKENMKNEKIKEIPIENALKFVGYVSSSYSDYISARLLFNNHMLVQGCCLANTAIEKFFKAIIDFRGNSTRATHNLKKLLPSIKNFSPEIYDKLNVEFLEELSKIYLTRYLDNCGRGYNFAILKNKYLAELDFTYSVLEPSLRYQAESDKRERKTLYETAVENKNQKLWLNNYILHGVDKKEFVEQIEFVHEMRIYEHNNELLEASYSTKQTNNDGKFRYEGFAPAGDHKSFTLSHKPILD